MKCPRCSCLLWDHLWDRDKFYCDKCDREYEMFKGALREINGRWLIINE